MNRPWLELRGASFTWGKGSPLLDQANLSVTERSTLWLFGPSGSGKSTFLRIVAGHWPLTKGECRLFSEPVTRPGPERCILPQDVKLFPWMTLWDNVASGMKFLRAGDREIRKRVGFLVDAAGLSRFSQCFPYQLSGGMQQRVGVLRCLAVNPRCLLLDEPFSAADRDNAVVMKQIIDDYLNNCTGTVCIIASHQIDLARRDDMMLTMKGGGRLCLHGLDSVINELTTRSPNNGYLGYSAGNFGRRGTTSE